MVFQQLREHLHNIQQYIDQACQNLELTQDVIDAMNSIVSILGTTKLTSDNIQTLSLTPTQTAALIAAQSTISNYIAL
jgi:hypothetical protein